VDLDPTEPGHGPVGDARRHSAHYKVVHPLLAPPAYQVITLFQHLQEFRNIFRIVLQVAIHGDHIFALGVGEAGGQGRSLPEIAPQLDHHHAAVNGHDLAQQLVGAIHAAVVHKHQLKRVPGGFHDRFQAVIERGHTLLFIVKRYYDRVLRHSEKLYIRLIRLRYLKMQENYAGCPDVTVPHWYFSRIFTVRSSSSTTSSTFSLRSLSSVADCRNSWTWARAAADCCPPMNALSQASRKKILRSRLTCGSASRAGRK